MAQPIVAWATALLLVRLSAATPIISFPVNSQVPPVARLGQPFSFIFSPSTFSSSSPVTYSLSDPPKWLSIDSDARRLFGTPGPDDVARGRVTGVPLNLVASDDSGSTTAAVTLVLAQSPGPEVEIPLEKQIPDFGTFSSPSAILSPPGEGFSFQLDQNTFSSPRGAPIISYYAVMADNTPLPAWISFDSANLSLSGQTPSADSLIQPPQRFSFQVIASDVVGFAGAALDIDIVVGTHPLAADDSFVVLNATRGTFLSYTKLREVVKVDGKPAAPGTLVIAATPNIPTWLSVDKNTWHVTGVPPEAAESTNFTVTVRDTFSNQLNLTILIEMDGDEAGLFAGSSPKCTITPGQSFSFDLGPYLSDPRDTNVSVEVDSSPPWIRFDSSTNTLFGHAPGGLGDSAVHVKITAKSRKLKKTASLSFDIVIRASPGNEGSAPTDSTTTGAHPTVSSGDSRSIAGDGPQSGRFNPMLLAVLLPLLLLLALGVCALFWYFGRRKNGQKPALSTRDISGPLPRSFVANPPSPGVQDSFPDFTKRFGKSFSADDVFGPDKKTYLESRNAFLTRPELPQPVDAVRLLPPSTSPPSHSEASQAGESIPATASGALVTLRPGTRGKLSSSLSSITETSTIGELADSRGLESVGNDSRRSFRDRLEINVPRILQTSTATSPPPTEGASTPRPGSAQIAPDIDAVPSRSSLRQSYYPPASAVRKLSWPWLRGIKGKRQGSKLVPGMKRLSEQSSVFTVDTFATEKTRQRSPVISIAAADPADDAAAFDCSSLPLPQFPSRASLSRPPTRSGPAPAKTVGTLIRQEPVNRSDTVTTTSPTTTPLPSLPSLPNHSSENPTAAAATPATPAVVAQTYADEDDVVTTHNPFRPSRTWPTVPTTMTDDWADETVESLALSPSASASQGQNWAVLQESPAVPSNSRGGVVGTASGLSGAPSLGGLALGRNGAGGGGAELKGKEEDNDDDGAEVMVYPTATAMARGTGVGGSSWERSGMTKKSQSKGVSLRSEGTQGSGSDYAVFI